MASYIPSGVRYRVEQSKSRRWKTERVRGIAERVRAERGMEASGAQRREAVKPPPLRLVIDAESAYHIEKPALSTLRARARHRGGTTTPPYE